MSAEGDVGLAAVRAAARLCEAVRAEMVTGTGLDKLDKADGSPVTIADFGAQAIVCHRIGQTFPGDAVVAEEDSQALQHPASAGRLAALTRFIADQTGAVDARSVCGWIDRGSGEPGARFWVLDPIDGTKGFLRNDQYAIALALIERGIVVRGFLACPALPYDGGRGVIVVAHRGAGSQAYTLEGVSIGPVRVSDVTDVKQARFTESYESGHTNHDLTARLKFSLGTSAETLRMDSQAKYAAIASGRAEIYLRSPHPQMPDYRENIWDHAAGQIIVEEAGGKVTDVYGRPLDWGCGRRLENNIGIVAASASLHEAVIAALAPLLPDFLARTID